jgi:hypothetical protein
MGVLLRTVSVRAFFVGCWAACLGSTAMVPVRLRAGPPGMACGN